MFSRRKCCVITTAVLLWIILLIQFFPFSLHVTNKISENLKTAAEFEKDLCSSRVMQQNQPWKEQQCPSRGFVTIRPGGRVGNKMWQYISVWGVARQAGLNAYIPGCLRAELASAFDSLTVPTLTDISQCLVNTSGFVDSLEKWNYKYQGIMVKSNAFLADISLTWVEDVRKEFTFKKDLVDKSQDILRTFVKNNTDLVFVGVHVRRTDYINYLWKKYSIKQANVDFYSSAMRYYEEKYKNAVFIIVSDDVAWCTAVFGNKYNAFVVGQYFRNSAYLDLAILAACNHSIFDYGTYGGWAAILAGGETIFYKINGDLTAKLAKLLPNWHALT